MKEMKRRGTENGWREVTKDSMIINLQGNEQVEDKEGARRIMIQVQRNKLPNPQQDNKDKYT